jgi:hypothetical protein
VTATDEQITAMFAERFWSKVQKSDTCWLWTAGQNGQHYGMLRRDGRMVSAHRVAYELTVGPIPKGLQLDHLCRTPPCVRPDHLEAVTPKENCLRGISPAARQAKQTHCIRGHPLSGANLYLQPSRPGERHCRTCKIWLSTRWNTQFRKPKSQQTVAAS